VVGDVILAGVITGAQLVAVRGNFMAAGTAGPFAPAGSFLEVDAAGSGVFSENQCLLVSPGNPSPLATLAAPLVAAANNVLTGGVPSLQIAAPDNKFTVLGNVTSNPIRVNGQNLAAPWAPLNVQA
jgi:hypothetical protein